MERENGLITTLQNPAFHAVKPFQVHKVGLVASVLNVINHGSRVLLVDESLQARKPNKKEYVIHAMKKVTGDRINIFQ